MNSFNFRYRSTDDKNKFLTVSSPKNQINVNMYIKKKEPNISFPTISINKEK